MDVRQRILDREITRSNNSLQVPWSSLPSPVPLYLLWSPAPFQVLLRSHLPCPLYLNANTKVCHIEASSHPCYFEVSFTFYSLHRILSQEPIEIIDGKFKTVKITSGGLLNLPYQHKTPRSPSTLVSFDEYHFERLWMDFFL